MAMIWVERRPRSLHLSRNEKYPVLVLGGWAGWWWLGGLGLVVVGVDDDVDDDGAECFWFCCVLFCVFVCM